ncbi:MAG TPA: hypothetical protein VMJ65_17470 [Solirubrobacteraceae bacterium]|nr:hypothetical protein [Solirubrobacteraceae bacterium]
MPKTYGLPVAFFAVPNENDPPDAAVVVADVVLALLPDDPLPALVLLLELLDPQPAAISPAAATTAAVPSHFERFICSALLWLCLRVNWVGGCRGQAAAASPR